MAYSHEEKEKSIDNLYYLVALVCGVFTGWVIDKGWVWIVVGAVLGLLTAALYLRVFVRGREEH
jgi:hypothetical protein